MLREIFDKAQDKTKEAIVKARSIIRNYLTYRNTIDKLMEDKVEDYIIVRELPLALKIGEKTVYIGTFSMETQDIFFREYTELLAAIGARHAGLELNIELLSQGAKLYKILQTDKFIKDKIDVLIEKTILKRQNYIDPVTGKIYDLPKVKLKYFRKYASYEDMIQICMLIYIYNFDSTRKSLQVILGELDAQASSEIYIFSWLKNLVGLNGKFLQNQLTKSGFSLPVPPSEVSQVVETTQSKIKEDSIG